MDNQFKSERTFSLHAVDINGEYLLIRAYNKGDSNLDVLFTGISYIESKDFFIGIGIRLATAEERKNLNQTLNFKDSTIDNYYVMSSGGEQFVIRAKSLSVFVNTLDFERYYDHSLDVGEYELIYEIINDGAKEHRNSELYAALYPDEPLKKEYNYPYESNRTFHLWAAGLPHFGLLLKSISQEDKTIDIFLTGVNYIAIKTQLDGIRIELPTLEEQAYLQKKCHLRHHETSKTSVICSNNTRFFIRAAFLSIIEHNSKADGYNCLIGKKDFGKLIHQ
ncbi:MAG: hypothetical protein AAF587_43295 [Bacteroidota bacterium]